MSERSNRREEIIDTATALFISKGYAVTSVRQIADAVGCTEAALYYHFKEGKRALLRAVIETQAPFFFQGLDACQHASSLAELLLVLGRTMQQHCEQNPGLMSWIVTEFPHLDAEEQALIREKFRLFQAQIGRLLLPFVAHPAEAEELAWVQLCALQGYFLIFTHLGFGSTLAEMRERSRDRLADALAHYTEYSLPQDAAPSADTALSPA